MGVVPAVHSVERHLQAFGKVLWAIRHSPLLFVLMALHPTTLCRIVHAAFYIRTAHGRSKKMADAPTPGNLPRKRVRAVRSRKDWSQQRLADEMELLGVPMDRSAVAKVETGARGVSIDEVFAFALALAASPTALLVPRAREASSIATRSWRVTRSGWRSGFAGSSLSTRTASPSRWPSAASSMRCRT